MHVCIMKIHTNIHRIKTITIVDSFLVNIVFCIRQEIRKKELCCMLKELLIKLCVLLFAQFLCFTQSRETKGPYLISTNIRQRFSRCFSTLLLFLRILRELVQNKHFQSSIQHAFISQFVVLLYKCSRFLYQMRFLQQNVLAKAISNPTSTTT